VPTWENNPQSFESNHQNYNDFRSVPKSQILLFSATYSKEVLDLATRIVPKPFVRLTLQRKDLSLDIIKQYYVQTKDEKEKYSVLASLIGYLPNGQMIIFTQTRDTAIELQKQMAKDGHQVGLLHGGKEMTSSERDKIMDSFRHGETKVLITTNVLARGIDVLQVC
jgi:ATP-dependent RNA helicase DDX19/DBP5